MGKHRVRRRRSRSKAGGEPPPAPAPSHHPAHGCVICGRFWEPDAGPYRIVCWASIGVWLSSRPLDGPVNGVRRFSHPLDEAGDSFVVFLGEQWRIDSITRALAWFRSGRHPWICQSCGGGVCTHCGSLLAYLPGADVIHDDGSIGHMGILPVGWPCPNPDCPGHRPRHLRMLGRHGKTT